MNSYVPVVMADDDADDFFLMQSTLEEQHVTNPLHHVASARQLFEFLVHRNDTPPTHRHLPGLIFLDINMPGMNGLEILEKLKTDADFRAIPVVVFSTVSNPETVRRAYQLGANSFITKPNSMQGMAEVVRCVRKCFLELPAVAA